MKIFIISLYLRVQSSFIEKASFLFLLTWITQFWRNDVQVPDFFAVKAKILFPRKNISSSFLWRGYRAGLFQVIEKTVHDFTIVAQKFDIHLNIKHSNNLLKSNNHCQRFFANNVMQEITAHSVMYYDKCALVYAYFTLLYRKLNLCHSMHENINL